MAASEDEGLVAFDVAVSVLDGDLFEFKSQHKVSRTISSVWKAPGKSRTDNEIAMANK